MKMKEILEKAVAFVRVRNNIQAFSKVKLSRKILCLALAFSCVGGILFNKELKHFTSEIERFATESGWIRYFSEEGGFSVDFPSDPVIEFKKLDIAQAGKSFDYSEYKSYLNDDVYYSVSYLNLPGRWKWAGSNTLLKGAVKILLDNEPGAVLVEKNLTRYKNYPAMEFRFKRGSDEMQGRLLLVGNTLFKLMVVYPPSVAEKLKDHPFLESFDLGPKDA